MSKLEEAILTALKEIKKEPNLRYLYIQNWFTNVLIKCEPEINVSEFYRKLREL